jgi:hypothetical protein
MISILNFEKMALGNRLFAYCSLFGIGNKLGYTIKFPNEQNFTDTRNGQYVVKLSDIF